MLLALCHTQDCSNASKLKKALCCKLCTPWRLLVIIKISKLINEFAWASVSKPHNIFCTTSWGFNSLPVHSIIWCFGSGLEDTACCSTLISAILIPPTGQMNMTWWSAGDGCLCLIPNLPSPLLSKSLHRNSCVSAVLQIKNTSKWRRHNNPQE